MPEAIDCRDRAAAGDGRPGAAMRAVAGTAEIISWGGFEKQYQIRIDPRRRMIGIEIIRFVMRMWICVLVAFAIGGAAPSCPSAAR